FHVTGVQTCALPILLFRPHEHARRFNRSAIRLGMPELDEQVFVSALEELVAVLERLVPARQGQSLYLRPTMFGATPDLSVVPSQIGRASCRDRGSPT